MRHSVLESNRIRRSVLVSAFALVFALPTFSQGQGDSADSPVSHARIVRISYVTGEVSLDSGNGYESVTLNVPVTENNRLQTRSDGWAEVQMEDGSSIRVAPDTQISFTTLARSASGGTVTAIDLDQGEVEFKVLKRSGNNFEVTVKNKTIVLGRPGSFRVTSTNDDPMEVAVWKGDLTVHDGESGEDVAVKKNETFVLDPADPARYALDPNTQADELDEWSKQRESAQGTYNAANPALPYQYGADDLSNYGQYTNDPEYGNVWQPYGVGMDWDPYSNGYYANTGLGYTWVSAYSWGWMPFRFGRWIFINGRGWVWAPGRLNRINAGPRFVHAPPGFHPPVPPADAKIVARKPGQVVRPGEIVGNGAGRRQGNNAEGNAGRTLANRPHVFTNDEVQTTPPEKTRQAIVRSDHDGKTFEREDLNNTGIQRNADRFHGEHVLPHEEIGVGEVPSASRPGHQLGLSQNSSSGSVRERPAGPSQEHSAPAQVMRQPSAPPVSHPSAPSAPPASHPSAPSFSPHESSGGGSHSSPASPTTGGGSPRGRNR
jgi:hypothetical protein